MKIYKRPENPHDKFDKQVLANEERMAEFFQSVLSEKFHKTLILSKAKRVDTSFVDPKYEYAYTDLLYHIPHRDGGNVYLYFLVEHKSYLARLVPMQILNNMLDVFNSYETRTPVIPLLLYHGTDKWTVADNFHDFLELEPAIRRDFGRFIPQYHYIKVLVREENLPESVKKTRIRVFFRALLVYNAKNQKEFALEFIKDILIYTNTDEELMYFNLLLEYVVIVYEGDLEQFYLEVEGKMGKAVSQLVMTAGQKMVYEGRKGGITEGKLEVAQNLLAAGVDVKLVTKSTGFSQDELKKAGLLPKGYVSR